jgi:hypothetical protein
MRRDYDTSLLCRVPVYPMAFRFALLAAIHLFQSDGSFRLFSSIEELKYTTNVKYFLLFTIKGKDNFTFFNIYRTKKKTRNLTLQVLDTILDSMNSNVLVVHQYYFSFLRIDRHSLNPAKSCFSSSLNLF